MPLICDSTWALPHWFDMGRVCQELISDVMRLHYYGNMFSFSGYPPVTPILTFLNLPQ